MQSVSGKSLFVHFTLYLLFFGLRVPSVQKYVNISILQNFYYGNGAVQTELCHLT